jgi:biopolymer transport protein ExbD
VNVYRDGAITLDQKQVTLPELVDKLKSARRQYNDLGVLVRGDADDRYQRIVAVLNACKQAGIQNLGIAVRPMAPNQKLE